VGVRACDWPFGGTGVRRGAIVTELVMRCRLATMLWAVSAAACGPAPDGNGDGYDASVPDGDRNVADTSDASTLDVGAGCVTGDVGVSGPSCSGLAATCGPNRNANCCESSVVCGGTYNRSNDANSPATVSDFRLDSYEITVGRFRSFFVGPPLHRRRVAAVPSAPVARGMRCEREAVPDREGASRATGPLGESGSVGCFGRSRDLPS
jgi:hypothetical protein